MNRLLLALLFLLVGLLPWPAANAGMAIAPGTATHTHSDANTGGGTLAVSGTLSSTKACASGFVRVMPNYCKALGEGTGVALSVVGTCVQSTALSGVTDAKAVVATQLFQVTSQNVAGVRQIQVAVYGATDTTCISAKAHQYDALIREQVATAGGTLLLTAAGASAILPSDATGRIVAKLVSNSSGGAFTANLYIAGYFD